MRSEFFSAKNMTNCDGRIWCTNLIPSDRSGRIKLTVKIRLVQVVGIGALILNRPLQWSDI